MSSVILRYFLVITLSEKCVKVRSFTGPDCDERICGLFVNFLLKKQKSFCDEIF